MEPSLRSRVRDGDPDAFGVLFDESARAVHNLAFRLTGNRHEAEVADELAGRLDDAARLAVARAAFGTLRPAEQDVVALCVWSELDYVAAAQALGIPVGTVRSRLSRARRKLRQLAGEPGGGGQPSSERRQAVRPAQGGTR
jgi:DNA-directed RNA polymerase specialized sigma24 family protein